MLYDLYAMYDADYLRKDIKRFPQLLTRITVFLKQRWSLVVHHMALLLFGYALIVVSATVLPQPNGFVNW